MDEAIRMRILKEAAELFHIKGYRSMTVGDLATRLGMSKKTLYVYFGGKEEIAEAVLELTLNAVAASVSAHLKLEGDPIDILKATFSSIKQEIVKVPPLFLEDIQKYVPALWAKVESFRSRQLSFVEELLTRAQQAGQIRDINTRLVAAMMMDTIQQLVRPDFAAKHGVTLAEVADTLFVLMLNGLRTDRT